MKCDCCRKRRKLFEAYSSIKTEKTQMHLCVNCTTALYKLRDAAHEKRWEEYYRIKGDLDNNQAVPVFSRWYKEYCNNLSPKEMISTDNRTL